MAAILCQYRRSWTSANMRGLLDGSYNRCQIEVSASWAVCPNQTGFGTSKLGDDDS